MGSNQTSASNVGLGAALATVLVTVASALGVDLDQTAAVALSGAIVTIVAFAVGRLTDGAVGE